jgi:hypothetical protein
VEEDKSARKRAEATKQPTPKLVKDKPEKILGVTRVQGELHFLVKYKKVKPVPELLPLYLTFLIAVFKDKKVFFIVLQCNAKTNEILTYRDHILYSYAVLQIRNVFHSGSRIRIS